MADGIIAEGFICPLCLKEFAAIHDLEGHYIETHSRAERDGFSRSKVKGIFGKAKEKLLKLQNLNNSPDLGLGGVIHQHDLDDTSPDDGGAFAYTTGGSEQQWDEQELGAIRDLSMDFKLARDCRIEFYAIEFNKLVIRLEKLLAINTSGTLDSKRRKAQEKMLIPWVKNDDVPLCPTCGKQFILARRRHHCRLCGAIMCNKCSEFIATSFAKDFIKDVKSSSEMSRPAPTSPGASGSSDVEEEPAIRSCLECYKVLIQKAQQIQDSNTKSVIEQLYKKLKGFMDEVDQDCPLYLEMCRSLRLGKEDYELEKVNQLRVKLIQLYEIIATVSKKIASLGLSADSPPSPTELRLQKAIRHAASVFLQNNLFALNTPPTEDEYNKLRRDRQMEIEKQIAHERRLATERHRQYEERRQSQQTETINLPRQRIPSATVVPNTGWLPQSRDTTVSTTDSTSDAMREQIEKVKSYIRQAKDAQRQDEVNMLEDNLKDLITEYSIQREREGSDL